MIGLDTNVLLRLGDDQEPGQRDRARALVRSQGANGCFVNAIVLAEFAWTLTRNFKIVSAATRPRLHRCHSWNRLEVSWSASRDEASRAVDDFRRGPADFADYFLAAINL